MYAIRSYYEQKCVNNISYLRIYVTFSNLKKFIFTFSCINSIIHVFDILPEKFFQKNSSGIPMIEVKKEGILLKKTTHNFENEGVLNPAVISEGDHIHP